MRDDPHGSCDDPCQCRWGWCRSTFTSPAFLADHVLTSHTAEARPTRISSKRRKLMHTSDGMRFLSAEHAMTFAANQRYRAVRPIARRGEANTSRTAFGQLGSRTNGNRSEGIGSPRRSFAALTSASFPGDTPSIPPVPVSPDPSPRESDATLRLPSGRSLHGKSNRDPSPTSPSRSRIHLGSMAESTDVRTMESQLLISDRDGRNADFQESACTLMTQAPYRYPDTQSEDQLQSQSQIQADSQADVFGSGSRTQTQTHMSDSGRMPFPAAQPYTIRTPTPSQTALGSPAHGNANTSLDVSNSQSNSNRSFGTGSHGDAASQSQSMTDSLAAAMYSVGHAQPTGLDIDSQGSGALQSRSHPQSQSQPDLEPPEAPPHHYLSFDSAIDPSTLPGFPFRSGTLVIATPPLRAAPAPMKVEPEEASVRTILAAAKPRTSARLRSGSAQPESSAVPRRRSKPAAQEESQPQPPTRVTRSRSRSIASAASTTGANASSVKGRAAGKRQLRLIPEDGAEPPSGRYQLTESQPRYTPHVNNHDIAIDMTMAVDSYH